MTGKQRQPAGLATAGKKLWKAVVDEFELADHEATQLEEACRIRDRLVDLRAQVEIDGIMIASSQGEKLHPAIAETRQHQLALARLLATLGVPGLEEDALGPTPGVRGVYGNRRRR